MATTGEELKVELLSTLSNMPNRGFDASQLEAEAVLRLADELAAVDPCELLGGWAGAEEALVRNWRLFYTSSLAFANNKGLTGFTSVQGVATPELVMQVGPSSSGNEINFFETLAPDSAALVARYLGLPGDEALPECVVAQGFWSCGTRNEMRVTLQQVVVGSYTYKPTNAGGESVWKEAAPGLIGVGGASGGIASPLTTCPTRSTLPLCAQP